MSLRGKLASWGARAWCNIAQASGPACVSRSWLTALRMPADCGCAGCLRRASCCTALRSPTSSKTGLRAFLRSLSESARPSSAARSAPGWPDICASGSGAIKGVEQARPRKALASWPEEPRQAMRLRRRAREAPVSTGRQRTCRRRQSQTCSSAVTGSAVAAEVRCAGGAQRPCEDMSPALRSCLRGKAHSNTRGCRGALR